ncbi:MAG TPA: serine/threonine protein kinase [Planctomycetota bacterium]|nr:serine/threonine protein kinase [Planctomycetota bacterium]
MESARAFLPSRSRGWQMLAGGWALACCAAAIGAVMLRGESTDLLALRYFGAISGQAVREVRNLMEPPQNLLQELASEEQRGVLSMNKPEEMGLRLAERLRFAQRLQWLSYSDDATGRFIGARRDGDRIILNKSDPAVDGGRPSEEEVKADGKRVKLDVNLPGGYDPRTKEWYRNAVKAQTVVWSRPFKFNEGVTGITAALALRGKADRPVRGVFTADFYLQDVTNFLRSLSEDGKVRLFLLDPGGECVATASPSDEGTLLKAALAASKPLNSMTPEQPQRFGLQHNAVPYQVSIESVPLSGSANWHIAIAVPDSHLLGGEDQRGLSSRLAVLAAVLGAGFVLFVAFRAWRRDATPTQTSSTHVPAGTPIEKAPTSVLSEASAQPPSRAEEPSIPDVALQELIRNRRQTIRLDDLLSDRLLAMAPRIKVEGRVHPCLGGIPLLSKLGSGAMGSVYYGVHPRLRMEVAVKVMAYMLGERNKEWITRFYREGQMAAMLKSPNIVTVHDVNEERGLFYMVMELVHGISAHQRLHSLAEHGEWMQESEALEIMIAAMKGLSVAHEMGIIHRDIKPDNILIPYESAGGIATAKAKLTDLGLARFEVASGSLTMTQTIMGTIGYMAPEQARDSKRANKASDVFGAGATLYTLLTNKIPFEGDSPFDTLLVTMEKPHEPIEAQRSEITRATTLIVDRCLSKDPAERFQDAAELLKALEACRTALNSGAAARR